MADTIDLIKKYSKEKFFEPVGRFLIKKHSEFKKQQEEIRNRPMAITLMANIPSQQKAELLTKVKPEAKMTTEDFLRTQVDVLLPEMKALGIAAPIIKEFAKARTAEKVIPAVKKIIPAVGKGAQEIFTGFTDLTTKVLNKLTGKANVSKQFVRDMMQFTQKKIGLSDAERNLISETLNEFPDVGKISVKDFANSVKAKLIPLKTKLVFPQYERTRLPDNLRGNIAKYGEIIYESPIKTSGGGIHYPGREVPNYFAHVRFEDVGKIGSPIKTRPYPKLPVSTEASDIRRILETQSDLMQKGRLEKELSLISQGIELRGPKVWDSVEEASYVIQESILSGDSSDDIIRSFNLSSIDSTKIKGVRERINLQQYPKEKLLEKDKILKQVDNIIEKIKNIEDGERLKIIKQRIKGLKALTPFKNDWYKRIVREEISRAAKDGKKTLQFPTGETAMKIEGLGETQKWMHEVPDLKHQGTTNYGILKPDNLKVGKEVIEGTGSQSPRWIITEVLEDGKFKAVNRSSLDKALPEFQKDIQSFIKTGKQLSKLKKYMSPFTEMHDISGKVDTQNYVYKLNEDLIPKYLKKIRPDMKLITDPQGVKWWEINLTKKDAKMPIEAFGITPLMFNDQEQ